ncbi:TIGR02452 family protein [Catenulispora sp. NL8]|uniref:TIGR02452 family protein n=1 Tax=Catenulispora pinistramenti TaxID=2705254 RepID=A0ABS5KT39_9ACTN|nr:TIGR02452 family protein [Catenulispora pinistramenti]MBS2549201.1 TIGR02452 family protein [Catenulispora pinistramenti]
MGIYKSVALENESIVAAGHYVDARGARVDLAADVAAACQGTRSYDPGQTLRLFNDQTHQAAGAPRHETAFEVTDETSTQAGQRLVLAEGATDVAILNFASARNPGGGYLGGARAQEEDLCRSSALYTTLLEARDYYDAHRANRDTRYSHRVIFSPAVPVYRDSATRLLDTPYQISYLTSPAPNAGALARHEPSALDEVEGLLTERAGRVLAVAAHHGVQTLVLGAWGCGVFRNDPATVARVFHSYLAGGGVFEGRFARVVFGVYDTSSARTTLGAFQTAFADLVSQCSAANSESLSRSQ